MMSDSVKPFVVGMGGTLGRGSSGERIARAVLRACEQRGASTTMFSGGYLNGPPHYSPETAVRSNERREFISAVRKSNGVVIASPGYHGGISGLVKNGIDLFEDLRDGDRSYFERRAVGLIAAAAEWQACGTTLSAVRDVLHALRGWPTPFAITVNTAVQSVFNPDGAIIDEGLAASIETQARQIMQLA